MRCKDTLYRFLILCAATLTLAACGGGGSGESGVNPPVANPTITGLAATGGALAGATVTAKCTSGPSVSGITGADGSFSLVLAGGQTVPCMLQVNLGTVTLHSFAAVAGYTNITPLTDLAISRALGSDAAAAFAAFDASKSTTIANGIVAAKAYVVAQVTPLTGAPTVDLLTGVFKVGDANDKLLDDLKTAVDNAGNKLDDLRVAAVSGGSLATVLTHQTWFFADGATLTASQINSFNTQGLYFNVHSAASPGGEIRSQIVPTSPGFITDNGNPSTSNTISALLSGEQEVPAKTSKATGYATIVLDPVAKTISGVVVTNGVVGTAAHIHDGLPGVAGPVLFPLTGGPTVWTVPSGTVLTDAQIASLTSGAYYVNVHSAAAPAGEIRGQLNQQLRFASLSGANEVPANASAASGIAVLALNPTTNLVTGFIKTTGITATAAHFHQAAAGVNGGVMIPLAETPAGSGVWVVPAGGQTLTAAQANAFSTDGVYANVHSTAFPGGEIRGQVLVATVTIGNAALDGSKEVPPVTTTASATGVMALNSITRNVQGNVKTAGIVGTAAHVHAAAAGVNGSVLVPLTLTPPPSTLQTPLAVSTTSLVNATVGSAYSQSLTATGGTTPYTWAVSTGTLPAGLNLSAAGVISGTPTAAGTASFSVSITDSASPTATISMALTLNVTAAATTTVSFAGQIQPIFTANCVTACHSPGGISAFLNLSAGSSFAALVQSTPPRVAAGSSATSLLFKRITGAALPQMPLAAAPLSASDQTLIRDWIDQGAANN